MPSSEDPKGDQTPETEPAPASGTSGGENPPPRPEDPPSEGESTEAADPASASTEDPSSYYEDPYAFETEGSQYNPETAVATTEPAPPPAIPPPPPPPPPAEDEEDEDDDGMLRMSFLGHLEELRLRIVRALMGVGVAFGFSLFFSDFLWDIVIEPVTSALREIGVDDKLIQITPMESFNILWIKLPILAATFLSSPWILYQVWAFIAPGLYKRERRWAAPFVIISAGLFILGGMFAYFIAFRYGLTFLLGIGVGRGIAPMITVSEYFNLFVNVMLTIGIVFQMPVLIFFLTLLRIVTPGFLLANSRYAILIIVIVAAIITPTPDVFNLMLFATPMCLLFFVGVFASYLLTMSRENRRIPWRKILLISGLILVVIMVLLMFAATQYGYQFGPKWPFLTR